MDYSLGKSVHYKRRLHMSKKIKDSDKKTDITVGVNENVVNAKAGITLRAVRKHIREPQKRLSM